MKLSHIHFETIESTNSWAKNHLNKLEENALTIITAHEQTDGRGQFNRKWLSPAGQNLYATFCLRLKQKIQDARPLSQLLSKATAEVLKDLGFQPQLKWPNDILISNKKVAGVLCELVTEHDTQWLVAGIGLNINMSQDLINKIDQPATSLFVEKGTLFSIEEILEKITQKLLKKLTLL